MELNDVAKQVISKKLKEACEKEGLSRKSAGDLLGLKSMYYASMIAAGNQKQFKNVSNEAWETVRKWTNSGESLRNFKRRTDIDEKKEKSETHAGAALPPGELRKKKSKIPPPPTAPPGRQIKRRFPTPPKAEKTNKKRLGIFNRKKVSLNDINKELIPPPPTADKEIQNGGAVLDVQRVRIQLEIELKFKINGQEVRL